MNNTNVNYYLNKQTVFSPIKIDELNIHKPFLSDRILNPFAKRVQVQIGNEIFYLKETQLEKLLGTISNIGQKLDDLHTDQDKISKLNQLIKNTRTYKPLTFNTSDIITIVSCLLFGLAFFGLICALAVFTPDLADKLIMCVANITAVSLTSTLGLIECFNLRKNSEYLEERVLKAVQKEFNKKIEIEALPPSYETLFAS